MSRVWTIIRKEVIHILRDPRTLALAILMPIMMLVLLGYAVSSDVEDISLALTDRSKTDTSRRFVERFEASGYFVITHTADNEEQLLQLIDEGVVKVGLFIPEEFGRNVTTGDATPIVVYVDGSDPTVAQTAQLAAETISQAASQEILVQQFSGSSFGTGIEMPIDARMRFLYNPNMRRMNFMIPGLVAVILQVQTLLLTSFAIVREREQGTLEQLIVTPLKPWELMLGKILPYVVVALLNVAMTVGVGYLWFGVKVAGSIGLLFVLSLVFLLGSLGLGVLISNLSRTQMQAMYLSTFIMLPSFLLTGLLYPRDNMPWLAYYTGFLIPVTYFLEIVRGIILKGNGLVYLWRWVWPMVLFSVIVFFTSVILFRKRIS